MIGMFSTNIERETIFNRGFPVGFHTGTTKRSSKHYLYNHIRIIIQYHDDKGIENPGGEASTTKVIFWTSHYVFYFILIYNSTVMFSLFFQSKERMTFLCCISV